MLLTVNIFLLLLAISTQSEVTFQVDLVPICANGAYPPSPPYVSLLEADNIRDDLEYSTFCRTSCTLLTHDDSDWSPSMEFYLRVNYTCGESGEQRACYYFVSTPNDRSFYSKVKLSLGDPLDQQSSSNVQFDTVDKCEHSNGRRRMKKTRSGFFQILSEVNTRFSAVQFQL